MESAGKKLILRRVTNRLFHVLARTCPGATTLRPALHRLRGMKVGRQVFIGDGVYLDNEYPECIEIHDNVQISIQAILIAHTRGPGRLIIERAAFIGPSCVIVCGAERILKIGEGAVIGAGAVVTKSVPPGLFISPPSSEPRSRVGVPLPLAKTMDEFLAGLEPLDHRDHGS